MSLQTNNIFKVVWIPLLTTYTGLGASIDPATAYFVADVKKIYVNNVAYGFTDDDITPAVLLNLLQTSNSLTINASFSVQGDKVYLDLTARVAPSTGSKTWVTTTQAVWDASSKTYDSIFGTNIGEFLDSLEGSWPAASRTIGDTARGNNGVIPITYFYAIVVSTGLEENLLKISSYGLMVEKQDIQDMIDVSVAEVRGPIGGPTGCYINNVFSGTQTTEIACNNANGVWLIGIASLDIGGLIPVAQLPMIPASNLPSYVDDIIEVSIRTSAVNGPTWFALYDGSGSYADTAVPPESGKIYVVVEFNPAETGNAQYMNQSFRYSGSLYINISNPNLKTLNDVVLTGSGNINLCRWTVL